MRKCNSFLLAMVLALAWTAPALAASKSLPLAAGGRTLAGPGSVALALNATATVYTDGGGSADSCATVSNTGSAPVRLTLVGDTTSTFDVSVAGSGALCKDNVQRVDLTCLGPDSCKAEWRVDDN